METIVKKPVYDNDPRWFVCYVRSCQERRAAEMLGKLGFKYYLPIVREIRQWSDRKKIMERLVLPHMIFIYCKPSERVSAVEQVSVLSRFMSDGRGAYHPVVVPDYQMEAFIAMVESGDKSVAVIDTPLSPGDVVMVNEGPLTGYKCQITAVSGRKCYAVALGALGTAIMELPKESVTKFKE